MPSFWASTQRMQLPRPPKFVHLLTPEEKGQLLGNHKIRQSYLDMCLRLFQFFFINGRSNSFQYFALDLF